MSPESWERLETLFAAALEQPADQRLAFVAAAGATPELTREVLALLEAHFQSGPLDSITDQLRGMRTAVAAMPPPDLIDRLSAGVATRYRIERELAHSPMAVVLLAEDLRHGRHVVLKVLQPNLAASIGPTRFLQEIAIVAGLAHPHILPLHDSGETNGLLYYVMPYARGESLRDRLRRERQLSLADALQITHEVADALSYAHDQQVVHCDIKPENILLQAGHAVVADFGIARAMSAAASGEQREALLGLATPAYASPEQLADPATVDARTDIYSLGCVMYEMLTGESWHNVAAAEQRVRAFSAQPTVRLPGPLSQVPATVATSIKRALATEPADRFATVAAFARTLPPPGHITERLQNRRVGIRRAVAVAGLTVSLMIAASMLSHSRLPLDPGAAVVAMLPPSSVTRDTMLNRLGRDLVVTLSANLADIGEIRTVDALTILAKTSASTSLTLKQAMDLAARLGASSVLHGTIVGLGGKVRVDVGLFTTDKGQTLARASVLADPLEVQAITDSLAWALLHDIWRTRGAPTPSLAGVTTRSLPALRAFLDGEHSLLESRWNDASDAYARALNADPGFRLAQWRYAYARWWYLDAVDDTIITALKANLAELPKRDQLVFESWVTDTFSVAVARAREAVEHYPDYWPAWMQYGDLLFHVGPIYGYDPEEARTALERTTALNPSFVPAWEHLLWAVTPRDTIAQARAVGALVRLGFNRTSAADLGFDLTRVYRLDLQWARTGRLETHLLDSVVYDLLNHARKRVGSGSTLLPVQVEISRHVLNAQPQPTLAAAHERLLADALAARGAWDSALVIAERHARAEVGSGALAAYRLAVIGAWLGAVAPAVALRHRVTASKFDNRPGSSAMSVAELAWLDGLLGVTQRDRRALPDARARIIRANAETSPLLVRSLAAFEAELGGARKQAAQDLAELNWHNADLLVPGYDAHPYVIAINRLASARWFVALGDTARAEVVLKWFDAAWALDGYRPARRVLTAFAVLERAHIAELEANPQRKREHYAEFIRRYDMPTASHASLVNEAKAALRDL